MIVRYTVPAPRPFARTYSTVSDVVVPDVARAFLLAGIAHSTLGPLELGGVSALAVHVGAAIVAVPLAVFHVVRRPQRLRATDLSRRTALRAVAVGSRLTTRSR